MVRGSVGSFACLVFVGGVLCFRAGTEFCMSSVVRTFEQSYVEMCRVEWGIHEGTLNVVIVNDFRNLGGKFGFALGEQYECINLNGFT